MKHDYELSSCTKELIKLEDKCDSLEQYTPRNSLRIFNPAWSESAGENTDSLVINMIKNDLITNRY